MVAGLAVPRAQALVSLLQLEQAVALQAAVPALLLLAQEWLRLGREWLVWSQRGSPPLV